MATKNYQSTVLNDNWFEERAEPLKGVLVDQGEKTSYVSESKDKFVSPPTSDNMTWSEKQRRHARKGKGNAMIQLENFDQIYVERKTARPEKGFGSLLPAPDAAVEDKHFDTTSRDAFGKAKRVPSTTLCNIKNGDVRPSGGAGGQRMDKGKSVSGASGEVYRTGADPKNSTAAQRSWTYSADPMLIAKMDGTIPGRTSEGTAVDSSGSSTRLTDFRIRSVLSGDPKRKDGIFADE